MAPPKTPAVSTEETPLRGAFAKRTTGFEPATLRQGAPCRKQAVDDGLCLFHSGKLDLAELGRRGRSSPRQEV